VDLTERPLPEITEETRSFWEGCRNRELLLQTCRGCGQFIFYPRSICPHCFSPDIEWVKASGQGKVYSYTVSFRPATPAFMEELPYVIAVIELEEGVRMMSNIVDCDFEDVRIGMPVEVTFTEITPEITLPRFRPV
jgi:uncharacterized OB-fold protein